MGTKKSATPAPAVQIPTAKAYRIVSFFNHNGLGSIVADSGKEAIEKFNAEMAPMVIDVYAIELAWY